MLNKYKIVKAKHKNKDVWHVQDEQGYIANGYHHPTRESAEKHLEVIEAYDVGGVKSGQKSNV